MRVEYYLIECATHGRAYDKSQTEEGFQAGERGRDIVGKFLGDDGEASRQKRAVSHRLYDSYHEGQNYEGIVTADFVQQAKKYGACCRS